MQTSRCLRVSGAGASILPSEEMWLFWGVVNCHKFRFELMYRRKWDTGVIVSGYHANQFSAQTPRWDSHDCSWTFMNSSWMFVNKKPWTLMNVHQRVHVRFVNIIEQQKRLSWKFMSSWTYFFHELALCSSTWVVHERLWTQIIHEQALVHERPWTHNIHEPYSKWTFMNVHQRCLWTIHEYSWAKNETFMKFMNC